MPKMTAIMALLAILCAWPARAEEAKPSAEAFLERARRPPGGETWALLQGEVEHRRRGQENLSAPLRVAIRFYPKRAVASVKIGKDELYSVGQPFNETEATIVRADPAKDGAPPLLGQFGLRPEDLTLTFLFWKFQKELAPASAGGRDCRVFELLDPKTKESAKVYISEEAFFPLKVEWDKPQRSLEIKSFKRVDEIYTPKDITLLGPGWRSRMSFTDNKAGHVKDGVPTDLF